MVAKTVWLRLWFCFKGQSSCLEEASSSLKRMKIELRNQKNTVGVSDKKWTQKNLDRIRNQLKESTVISSCCELLWACTLKLRGTWFKYSTSWRDTAINWTSHWPVGTQFWAEHISNQWRNHVILREVHFGNSYNRTLIYLTKKLESFRWVAFNCTRPAMFR